MSGTYDLEIEQGSVLELAFVWNEDGQPKDLTGFSFQAEVRKKAGGEEVLLDLTHDELPYSIATRVTNVEDDVYRCEIVVERESQKGMVIGKGGSVLREIRRRVRKELPKGAGLELVVTVDKDWQHRPDRVQRLGY